MNKKQFLTPLPPRKMGFYSSIGVTFVLNSSDVARNFIKGEFSNFLYKTISRGFSGFFVAN